jgi:hypothetical protein
MSSVEVGDPYEITWVVNMFILAVNIFHQDKENYDGYKKFMTINKFVIVVEMNEIQSCWE